MCAGRHAPTVFMGRVRMEETQSGVAARTQGVGFAGPLLLEKVPGRTLAEIDENFRLAKEFVAAVAQRTAAGPSL